MIVFDLECSDGVHRFEGWFKSSDDFDINIIKTWNEQINDDDIVYLLGDVVYNIEKVEILSQLKGHKILIIGNYDEKHTDILKNYFDKKYEL